MLSLALRRKADYRAANLALNEHIGRKLHHRIGLMTRSSDDAGRWHLSQ